MAETPYTDEATIASYLKRELTTSEQAIVDDLIAAATSFINDRSGRRFDKQTNKTRYFQAGDRVNPSVIAGFGLSDSPRNRFLFIDDCLSITSIAIVDTELNVVDTLSTDSGVDFITYPLNTDTGESFNYLYRVGSVWPSGNRTVKITGNWGYADEVPASVKVAASKMVAEVIGGLTGGGSGDVKRRSVEGATVEYFEQRSDEFEKYIDQFVPKRVRIFV